MKAGLLPRSCASTVRRCASKSPVGKPGFASCGRVASNGRASCRLTPDPSACDAFSFDECCCEFEPGPTPHFTPFADKLRVVDLRITERSECYSFDFANDYACDPASGATCLDTVTFTAQFLCTGATCEASGTSCIGDAECGPSDRCVGHCKVPPSLCANPATCNHSNRACRNFTHCADPEWCYGAVQVEGLRMPPGGGGSSSVRPRLLPRTSSTRPAPTPRAGARI